MQENYGMDCLALFLMAIPVAGLAVAIKRIFVKVSVYGCLAISILIIGGAILVLAYIGSRVGA